MLPASARSAECLLLLAAYARLRLKLYAKHRAFAVCCSGRERRRLRPRVCRRRLRPLSVRRGHTAEAPKPPVRCSSTVSMEGTGHTELDGGFLADLSSGGEAGTEEVAVEPAEHSGAAVVFGASTRDQMLLSMVPSLERRLTDVSDEPASALFRLGLLKDAVDVLQDDVVILRDENQTLKAAVRCLEVRLRAAEERIDRPRSRSPRAEVPGTPK